MTQGLSKGALAEIAHRVRIVCQSKGIPLGVMGSMAASVAIVETEKYLRKARERDVWKHDGPIVQPSDFKAARAIVIAASKKPIDGNANKP